MQKKRLLLLYPGVFFSTSWGPLMRVKPHMVYLYSYLKKKFDVIVVDLECEFLRPRDRREIGRFKFRALKRLFLLLGTFRFDYVAISCWSSLNYQTTFYFASVIKKIFSRIKIIVGGYHPTSVPEDFTYDGSPFDYVVRGGVEGIFDVLNIPSESADFFDRIVPEFETYPYFKPKSPLGLFLSFGCPFNCSYCIEYRKKMGYTDPFWAARFLAELERKYAPQRISIFDPCFGVDKAWRTLFLKEMVKYRLRSYIWAETNVNVMDEETLELIALLNFKLDFGVDSFSKTMLTIMRKTNSPDQYLEKLMRLSRKASELKILHDAYLIFNHPGESAVTFGEYGEFFRQRVCKELIGGFLRIRFQGFFYCPGSYVANHIGEFEKEYGTQILYPQWWKKNQDHFVLSSSIVPSRDEKNMPFQVDLGSVGKEVSVFNSQSQDVDRWREILNLHVYSS